MEYGKIRIPDFRMRGWDQKTHTIVNNTRWEIRKKRILAVQGTNLVLLYASEHEYPRLKAIVDAHNGNLLIGITDAEYNEQILHSL